MKVRTTLGKITLGEEENQVQLVLCVAGEPIRPTEDQQKRA